MTVSANVEILPSQWVNVNMMTLKTCAILSTGGHA